MGNNVVPSSKKNALLIKVFIALFVVGMLWLGISNLPSGYSRDLSQIGKGKNVAVLVHDHNLMGSVQMMEALNKVRPDYAATVEFVVADLTTVEAQTFATTYDVSSVTLVFFGPDGTQRGSVKGSEDLNTLRGGLNQAFNLNGSK